MIISEEQETVLRSAIDVLTEIALRVTDAALKCKEPQPCQHCFEAIKLGGNVADAILKIRYFVPRR